ncbi:MAG: hypothetical protein ACRC7V_06265 [Lachnospiraceae bacterium]
MMTHEKQEELKYARLKIDKVNKFRLAFLFLAVILSLLLYFGNQFLSELMFYQNLSNGILFVTGVVLIFLVITTFLKLFYTIQYNQKIKKK